MAKRDDSEFKIREAAAMMVKALPPITEHPGAFIRNVLLPEYGLNVSSAAAKLGIVRAGFHGVLSGKYDVSRDLAYKLGALMRDEVADLLINYQLAYDLAKEKARRAQYRKEIARVEPISS